jgi:hypothetical protein
MQQNTHQTNQNMSLDQSLPIKDDLSESSICLVDLKEDRKQGFDETSNTFFSQGNNTCAQLIFDLQQ